MSIRNFLFAFSFFFAYVTAAQTVSEAPSRTIATGKAELTAFAIAPKGDRLLVGTDNGAGLFEIESGKKIYALAYNEDKGTAVYYVAFNENGEYAVLMGHSGKRTVWNLTDGKQERVITSFRWIPDPRSVKAMGLDMSNSTFDRFYQQGEVKIGDVTVRAGKNGIVEFVGADGKVQRTITFPENKDQHHRAPLFVWEGKLLIGTDNGNVVFYDLL